jgi:carboxyl-terminal processing protease
MKRKWLLATLIVLAISIMVVNAQLSRDFSDEFLRSPTGKAFMQVYGSLKSGYLNDVQDDKIIQGAINGMIEALDDPFTYYADPEATSRRNEDMSGSFEGIGAVLEIYNRQSGKGVQILNVYRDGPAFKAGILKGDIFLEVDGVNVEESTTNDVAGLVRGPKGTQVNIKMQRPGTEKFVVFDITRGTINIVSVESTVLENKVGYLHLTTFSNQRLYEQMLEQLDKLKGQGITSLILDMRDNGGGLLNQGILIADEFLNEGDIVFERARGVTKRLASADDHWFDLPMVVLVNRNSASASEIVAGALQENDRAKVIGEKTFGKGVAQNVISLSDGGQLAFVAFEWLTPKRRSIQKEGITPDVEAIDTLAIATIAGEGQGVDAGKEIQIVVDGELVATTIADEEGAFKFVGIPPNHSVSEVQGEAIVDIANDNALKVAFDTLLQQVASAQ